MVIQWQHEYELLDRAVIDPWLCLFFATGLLTFIEQSVRKVSIETMWHEICVRKDESKWESHLCEPTTVSGSCWIVSNASLSIYLGSVA